MSDSQDYGPAKTYFGSAITAGEAAGCQVTTKPAAMQAQVGGDHYSKLGIEPGDYAMVNNFNYWQSHAIGYLTRYKDKGGKRDLKKLINCIQHLIRYEYGTDA